jgi:hypothetical protein
LQEVVEEVMGSAEECMKMIGECDFRTVRSIKGLTLDISNFSGTSKARAANVELVCTKMLNIGYAMANCKVRKVGGMQQISEKSILDKLLKKRGKQLVIETRKPTVVPESSNLEKFRRRGRLMTQNIAVKVVRKNDGTTSSNATRKGSELGQDVRNYRSEEFFPNFQDSSPLKVGNESIQESIKPRLNVSQEQHRKGRRGVEDYEESKRDDSMELEFRVSQLDISTHEKSPLTGRIDISDQNFT